MCYGIQVGSNARKGKIERHKSDISIVSILSISKLVTMSGQDAYLERIPIGAKIYILHPVPCLVDTEAELSLMSKDVVPTH